MWLRMLRASRTDFGERGWEGEAGWSGESLRAYLLRPQRGQAEVFVDDRGLIVLDRWSM